MLKFDSFLRAVNDRPYEWMTMGCLEFEGDCHARKENWLAMTGNSWCGNPRRAAGRIFKTVSFRTSPQTGVGISIVIEAAFSKTMSFRTSPQTGVGISPVIETAFS